MKCSGKIMFGGIVMQSLSACSFGAVLLASSGAAAASDATNAICYAELDGAVVLDGRCYMQYKADYQGSYYLYGDYTESGGVANFSHLVVLNVASDNEVDVWHNDGNGTDGANTKYGFMSFDGECFASERGRVCIAGDEAAD